MKKNDIILIGIVLVIALASLLGKYIYEQSQDAVDGTAVVYYLDSPVLEIELEDGSYTILDEEVASQIDENKFSVTGTNGPVLIEYSKQRVRVYEETSPQHICRIQGWSNSPLKPITCLPNNVVILIETSKPNDDLPDDITG